MSDEEESLLSQDDIDNLMNFDLADDQDDGGEMSQDDIDNFMGGDGDDDGELSQDDIDRLMGGGNTSGEPEPEEEEGELSQEDIDRMLGKSTASEDDDDEDISELISMDDIQKAINSGGEEPESSQVQVPEETSVPQGQSAREENEGEEEDESDYIIDASEAGDMEDNLILKEVLDALMEGPLEDIPQEAVTESEAGEANEDTANDTEARAIFDPASQRSESAQEDQTPVILEDDMADPEIDPDEITQQDIDSLLMESDDEVPAGEDEDDILISQDDINTLLMVVDQEDEDLLGDMDGEQNPDFEAFEDSAEGMDDQPVVLEGMDNEKGEQGKESSSGKPWFASKLFLVAASVLLFVAIAVPATYFLIFSGDQETSVAGVQGESFVQAPLMGELDEYGPEMTIDTDEFAGMRSSGQLVLKGFIVPVADSSNELAYVEADVSIDYTDQRIPDEIHANIAFYRDIVFDAIKKAVGKDKKAEVTAAALIWAVETNLKKVLPERFIERVEFSSFSSS